MAIDEVGGVDLIPLVKELKNKMYLYVDDIRDAPDDTWMVARKVEEAIRLIDANEFEKISLDHDIENRPSDETFKPVAYFIAEKYRSKVITPLVIIHTMNPVAAQQIKAILDTAHLKPIIKPGI